MENNLLQSHEYDQEQSQFQTHIHRDNGQFDESSAAINADQPQPASPLVNLSDDYQASPHNYEIL